MGMRPVCILRCIHILVSFLSEEWVLFPMLWLLTHNELIPPDMKMLQWVEPSS